MAVLKITDPKVFEKLGKPFPAFAGKLEGRIVQREVKKPVAIEPLKEKPKEKVSRESPNIIAPAIIPSSQQVKPQLDQRLAERPVMSQPEVRPEVTQPSESFRSVDSLIPRPDVASQEELFFNNLSLEEKFALREILRPTTGARVNRR